MGNDYIQGGGGGIPPFIQADGTLYTFESDAYLETLPFRSDAVGIAGNTGNYLTDLDNPDLSHHSNMFKNSTDPEYWWSGVPGEFGIVYNVTDHHRVFGPVKDYNTSNLAQPLPIMAHYQAIYEEFPVGEQAPPPIYYEDGRYIYGETGGSDDYIYSEQDVPGANIDGGWYKACYGRYNTNINPAGDTYSADILANATFARFRLINDESNSGGFNNYRAELQFTPNRVTLERNNINGGLDAWELRDRGPQVSQTPDRVAYYQNNPSSFDIGRELDHIPNVRFILENTVTTIPDPFDNTYGWNATYDGGGAQNGSRLELEEPAGAYDAVFYVAPVADGGTNSGTYTTAERKNNRAIPYASIYTAWLNANNHELSTGERTLVWVLPGFYSQTTNFWFSTDIYYDHKAVHRATAFGRPGWNCLNNGGLTKHPKFLGRGTLYNSIFNHHYPTRECFLGNFRSQAAIRIQADFLDNIWHFAGPGWIEAEVVVKEFWSRNVCWQGASTLEGTYRFKNTTFPNGVLAARYRAAVDVTLEFKDCILTTPFNESEGGGTDRLLIDNNGITRHTYVNSDNLDTALLGYTSSQEVVDNHVYYPLSDLPGRPDIGITEISSCFAALSSNNAGFRNGMTGSKFYFYDCTFLINKPYTLAAIIIQPANFFTVDYESRFSGGVVIDGGIVSNWSGTESSAFFTATNPAWANVMPFTENIAKWTGDSEWTNAPKYIETFTPGLQAPEFANHTVPIPNQSARQGRYLEEDGLVDISGTTDNIWSTVNTDYRLARLELLVRAVGPGNPNINVFVRETGSVLINRGGPLTQHTMFTVSVITDAEGNFELLQTDNTITNIRIISTTSNRR